MPVAADTAEGTAVRIGTFSATDGVNLNGVTETAENEGGNIDGEATVALDGVFNLPITTTTAIAIGGPVYITSAGALTPVATSNALFGHVVKRAKGTTAGEVVPVRIKN
jgi:predicted RecA/RadA family phage recombinase